MLSRSLGYAALLLLAAAAAPAANAATVAFSGTRMNVDSAGPQSPRCGSRTTSNIRVSATSTSSGTSNFGDFTPTLTHCIQLPLQQAPNPFDLGEFLFEFATGDTLFGSYSGVVTPNAPGLFNIDQTHLVTGGTGLFLGATGSFTSMGTLSFLSGPPRVQQTFAGTLDAPAIPEPATWGMMILGFGAIGATLRRRRPALAAA